MKDYREIDCLLLKEVFWYKVGITFLMKYRKPKFLTIRKTF
jgi:hypothetical protein